MKNAKRACQLPTFHFLNQALRQRGVCDNILLEHDGDCPPWLAENARQAVEIAASLPSDDGCRPPGH